MNCQKYEQLIALYVEDDLPRREAAKVANHLTLCEPCHRFADELRESQNALRTARADEFSEAMLADLRRSVMGEITLRPAANGFWSHFFRPLRWQYAVLAGLLALLAVSAMFYWRKPDTANQQAVNGRNNPGPGEPVQNPGAGGNDVGGKNDTFHRHDSRPAPHLKFVRKGRPDAGSNSPEAQNQMAVITKLPEMNPPTPSLLPNVESPAPAETLPPANSSGEAEPAPATDDSKIRMEIQTRDPNVRIIWFVNKEPRRAAETE
jgi:Putative zinc-finger